MNPVKSSIYGLFDPRDKGSNIRYVGFTSKDLKKRLCEHIYESKKKKNHRHKWIASLLSEGVLPEIVLIERVCDEEWKAREQYWISYYGSALTNSTIGGEGLINPTMEVGKKISKKVSSLLLGNVYRKGIPHSADSKAAISQGLLSSEKFKSASERKKGKVAYIPGEETKRKISEAHKGRENPLSRDRALAMCEGNKGSFWVNNSEVSKLLRKGEDIPEGFVKGRLPPSPDTRAAISCSVKSKAALIYTESRNEKIARSREGGRWISNGKVARFIKSGAPPVGWAYGRGTR